MVSFMQQGPGILSAYYYFERALMVLLLTASSKAKAWYSVKIHLNSLK